MSIFVEFSIRFLRFFCLSASVCSSWSSYLFDGVFLDDFLKQVFDTCFMLIKISSSEVAWLVSIDFL